MADPINDDLVGRLEKAEAGSRELDAEIWSALVECDRAPFRYWVPVDEHHGHGQSRPGALYYAPHCAQVFVTPEVTTSLDAALALAERVLPGAGWNIRRNDWGVTAEVYPYEPDTRTEAQKLGLSFTTYEPKTPPFGSAPTPALALCIAILKARPTAGTGSHEDAALSGSEES